jgi:ABC-2 type transport system permease protein
MMKSLKHSFYRSTKPLRTIITDVFRILMHELQIMFHDRGVMILFVVATLAYPPIYNAIYRNETITNMPIGAVDLCNSKQSDALLRKIDATPEVNIIAHYSSLAQARQAFDHHQIRGIVLIPADYDRKLSKEEQATVSIYCDMSSFMYYRTMMTACNYPVLDMNQHLQIQSLESKGITGEAAREIAAPIPYDAVILYNPMGGFASFLMPVLLILILHQTLFFGIGMAAGTAREENRFHRLIPGSLNHGGIYRVVLGKGLAYFLLYAVLSFYVLGLIPRLFGLPHLAAMSDLIALMIPFLLATIFFSMTISVFMPNRETSLVLFLFFSLILLFLSGISWPESNMAGFWKWFSWLFPSTLGIRGYIKMNTFGADVYACQSEYISLWIQTGFYFLLASMAYHWQMAKCQRSVARKAVQSK